MTMNPEKLELHLMNAYLTVENSRPEESLQFLSRIEPYQLTPGLLASYFSIKGQAKILLKEYAAGIAYLRQSICELEKGLPGTSLQIGWVRNRIGLAYYEQRYISLALVEHQKCLKAILDGSIEDRRFSLKIYLNMGNNYFWLGRKENALECYRRALVLADTAEDREDLAALFIATGLAYRDHNNLNRAKLYLGKGLENYLELGNLTQAGRACSLLGLVMSERAEFGAADVTLKRAIGIGEALGDRGAAVLSSAATNLSALYRRLENWVEAEKWAELGLEHALRLNDRLKLSRSQAQLAEVKLGLEKEREAFELFDQAVANIEQTTLLKITSQLYYRYGTVLKQAGRVQEAFGLLEKACLVSMYHTEPSKPGPNSPFLLDYPGF